MTAQIEYRQVCKDTIQAASKHSGYIQQFDYRYGFHCTCRGFQFRKTCKHIEQFKATLCDWTEMHGDEHQTVEGICPKCVKEAMTIQVAV